MLDILFNVMAFGGLLFTLTGILVWGAIFFAPKKAPMDASNRINHLRIVWFAISAPHRFSHCRGFTWLQGDERDNLKDTDWTNGTE